MRQEGVQKWAGWPQASPCVVRGGGFVLRCNGELLGAGFKQQRERDTLCLI